MNPGGEPPQRIVSLVPSLTEALFALGLGERVVDVTDWCVYPAVAVASLPKVGGTKNPTISAILELRPDLVLANREENRRESVERLKQAGVPVWVTYPRTVGEGVALLRELSERGASEAAVADCVEPVETAFRAARAARAACTTAAVRVFCPIWKNPWMAVGGDTYANDLLATCGGSNVFAERAERRYPLVTLAEIEAAAPEVILLPDEPYVFGPRDASELAQLGVPAASQRRIHLIDGTLVSWYGPRIRRALDTLRPLLAPLG